MNVSATQAGGPVGREELATPMHVYRSRFLLRGEVWYDNEPDDSPVDWIVYHQRSRPVPRARWKYFHTIVVDLTQSPEELLEQMSDSSVYKIRRARDRDGVIADCFDPLTVASLDVFEQMYTRFAASKGLGPLDRKELDDMAVSGALEISVAKDPQCKPLAYHAYYRGPNRSRLLHSVSLYRELDESAERNAIGRANRYLFWADMLRHREQGITTFDFGGWYPGKTDQGLLDINRFKEGFGGRIVREYDCEEIRSMKGWVVLTAARLLKRAGVAPGAAGSAAPNTPEGKKELARGLWLGGGSRAAGRFD